MSASAAVRFTRVPPLGNRYGGNEEAIVTRRADDMDRQLDQWAAQVQEKERRYRALNAEMASIAGRAASPGGAARVTVDRAGVLTDLDIADDLGGMRGGQLADEIMSTIRTAQAGLGQQIVAMMQVHVPEDTASIASVSETYQRQFPEVDTEDGQAAPPSMSNGANSDSDDDDFNNNSVFQ